LLAARISINVRKHLRDMVNPSERRLISFFAAIWVFIIFVSVVDGYLVYRHRQQMLHVELNPIGRALIQWNGGQIWYLLLAKLVGTVAACAALLVIHRVNVRFGLAIAIGVAVMQLSLLIFLLAT
jgi:tryptophan-rich sensory protein